MIYGNRFYGYNIVNENYVIDLDIKNPEELISYMKKNIKYKQFTKLMTPEEVFNLKKGSCHDQVVFENYFFKKFDLKYNRLFAIEYNENESKGGRTHSFLWYIKNNKYYWFENSWSTYTGINGPYNSLSDLKNDFKEKMLKETNKYNNVLLRVIKNVKPGMTLDQYVSACIK